MFVKVLAVAAVMFCPCRFRGSEMKSIVVALGILLAGATVPIRAQQRVEIGDYVFARQTEPMDDTDRSFITTLARDSGSRSAALSWMCTPYGLNVLYVFDRYFSGSNGRVMVRYRVDSNPPSSVDRWGFLQTSNRAVWMPNGKVKAFTEQALPSNKVVLRVIDPSDGKMLTDEFSLNGLTRALGRLPCASEFHR